MNPGKDSSIKAVSAVNGVEGSGSIGGDSILGISNAWNGCGSKSG